MRNNVQKWGGGGGGIPLSFRCLIKGPKKREDDGGNNRSGLGRGKVSVRKNIKNERMNVTTGCSECLELRM